MRLLDQWHDDRGRARNSVPAQGPLLVRVGASLGEILRIATQLRKPLDAFIEPPTIGPTTGWERRRTTPLISRQLLDQAERGDPPMDHEIYDQRTAATTG